MNIYHTFILVFGVLYMLMILVIEVWEWIKKR